MFDQKGQENTTSYMYNLQYWPCYHGRNVRLMDKITKNIKPEIKEKGEDLPLDGGKLAQIEE